MLHLFGSASRSISPFGKGQDVRGAGLVAGGKPAGVNGRSRALQEFVLDGEHLGGLAHYLQHKTFRSPGMAGQRAAGVGNGERTAFREIHVETGSLIVVDLLYRATGNLVVFIEFLKPDTASGGHVFQDERIGLPVFSHGAFYPLYGRTATGHNQPQRCQEESFFHKTVFIPPSGSGQSGVRPAAPGLSGTGNQS